MEDRINRCLDSTDSSEFFTKRCFRKARDFIYAYRCVLKLSFNFQRGFEKTNNFVLEMRKQRNQILPHISPYEEQRLRKAISQISELQRKTFVISITAFFNPLKFVFDVIFRYKSHRRISLTSLDDRENEA